VLALLALSPKEWIAKLGGWADFLFEFRVQILAGLVIILTAQLFLARQPFLSRLEYIVPVEYGGVPDMLPNRMQSKVTEILEALDENDSRSEHVARIIVLTGQSTLHYLDQIVKRFPAKSGWEIKVLLMDPDAPSIARLEEGAREQVLGSCAMLASLRNRAVKSGKSVKVSWRVYSELPMIRAFLINEHHLFFGYFAWDHEHGSWTLHEQNKGFIHAKRGDPLSRDSIEFFKGWFDYQWAHGRELDPSRADDAT
jgi:hypothetical protein